MEFGIEYRPHTAKDNNAKNRPNTGLRNQRAFYRMGKKERIGLDILDSTVDKQR